MSHCYLKKILMILLLFLSTLSLYTSFYTKFSYKMTCNNLQMKLINEFDALFFDCDGVIAETERFSYLVIEIILFFYS